MLNKALFIKEWKSNYKLLIIFCLVLSMYISLIISMFDPKLGSALEEFNKSMPQLMAMFGMGNTATTLISFISNYLYGMLLIAFPMIAIILISLRLVVRHVDRGSMAYLLSNRTSRNTFIRTQISVLVTFILALLAYCTLLGMICSMVMFPDELDIKAFLALNLGLLCVHMFIGGFCFMLSCICSEYKNAAMIGAGIPILFLLVQMLANMGDSLENLKYATIFTLFNPDGFIKGDTSAFLSAGVLFLAGCACFLAGSMVFRKNDLSI